MSGADPSIRVARKHLQQSEDDAAGSKSVPKDHKEEIKQDDKVGSKNGPNESSQDPNERILPATIAREFGHLDIVELLELDAVCGECEKPMSASDAKRCAKCKVCKTPEVSWIS